MKTLELVGIREKKLVITIDSKSDDGRAYTMDVERLQEDGGEPYLVLPNRESSARIYLCELLAMLRLLGYEVVQPPKEQPKRGRGRPKESFKRMVRR
jgi:hypothetical protein